MTTISQPDDQLTAQDLVNVIAFFDRRIQMARDSVAGIQSMVRVSAFLDERLKRMQDPAPKSEPLFDLEISAWRDKVAMHVAGAVWAGLDADSVRDVSIRQTARCAYMLADAMLEARNEPR